MNIDAALLLKDLQSPEVSREQIAQSLQNLSLADLQRLLSQSLHAVRSADETSKHTWLQPICEALSRTLQTGDQKSGSPAEQNPELATTIGQLYAELGPHFQPRYQLLTCLAQMGSQEGGEQSLAVLADKMVDDPPTGIGPTAAPLVQLCRTQTPQAIATLFPRLLDALANPDAAPAVLDLASFFRRTDQVGLHPAQSRIDGLLTLAEAVVASLEPLQADLVSDPDELRARQERVAQSLPLAVSLCDALGLIGDDRALPTLQRIGELKHRRLRVESAAARVRLARNSTHEIESTIAEWLEDATKDLVAMAAEPSVRMRVLAYAEELDVLDRVAEEFESPLARAEGELTTFLSQPTEMGLPPDHCELVDSRTLYWPSFEEPRNCYLFRYEYHVQSPDGTDEPKRYANLAIAGPVCHALHADLTDLPIEDVYATFAGWQAEHEEIRHREIDRGASLELLPKAVRELVARVPEDYASVQPAIFGLFFGQPVLVASAQRGTALGSVVMDDRMHEPNWYPIIDERSVGAGEAWLIYKGKRLLDSFNDDWTEAG